MEKITLEDLDDTFRELKANVEALKSMMKKHNDNLFEYAKDLITLQGGDSNGREKDCNPHS